jgi:hypothetical protein
MKRIAFMIGLFGVAALIVLPVAGSGNYSPSNSAVERNLAGTSIVDGGPRPPLPPLVLDGSPRPPIPPRTAALDGSPRPPLPPGPVFVADGPEWKGLGAMNRTQAVLIISRFLDAGRLLS